MIQPTRAPTLAIEISKTELHASVNKDQHSETCRLSIPVISDQTAPPVNEKGQSSPPKPNGEKSLLGTSCGQEKNLNTPVIQGFVPLSEHHDLSKKGNKMDTREADLFGRSCYDEALSHPNRSGISILEPQSPILGSRRIVVGSCSPVVRAKKGQIKSSSPIFGSKRKLTLSDAVSVKRQINHDDISVDCRLSAGASAGKEEQTNINSCHGNYISIDYLNCTTRTSNLNDVHETELNKCSSQARVGQNEVRQSQDRILCLHIPHTRCCTGEHTPSDCSVDHLSEEIIQSGSCRTQSDSKTSGTDLNSLVWSDLSLSQGHAGLCVDDCASQSIAVPSEGTNSQLDLIIEAPLTPCKNSMNGTDISEVSLL